MALGRRKEAKSQRVGGNERQDKQYALILKVVKLEEDWDALLTKR